jgi:hypothetical protein
MKKAVFICISLLFVIACVPEQEVHTTTASAIKLEQDKGTIPITTKENTVKSVKDKSTIPIEKQKATSSNIASTGGVMTVFIGFPQKKISEGGLDRVVEDLPRTKAANLRCVISKIEGKYYWASRENVEMVKIERPLAYITFLAVNGSGYVTVIKPQFKEAASLVSNTEESFDYIEHLTIGLRSVNYWGEKEHLF